MFCVLFSNTQDGELDLTFNPMDVGFENGDGTNGSILRSAKQPVGNIKIYPDPVKDAFYLNKEFKSISVFSINEKLIKL